MNDFWSNITRYPRFFISSVTGLVFIILTPFRNLLKIKKLRLLTLVSFVGSLTLLYFIIANMTAT